MDDERHDDKGQSDQDRRSGQWQYDFLKRCSEKGEEGIREWNRWREQNPTLDICLSARNFQGWYLRSADLMQASTRVGTEKSVIKDPGEIHLRGANFKDANVENCVFCGAHLEGTCWWYAKARGTRFDCARLNDAELGGSELDGCRFDDAVLSGAVLTRSSLRGAEFVHSDLRECRVRGAITDGATMIWECNFNKGTDFTGVGLDSIRVDPGTKQALEYAVRRRNWERWYATGKPDYVLRRDETVKEEQVRKAQETRRCILTSPVRLFWFVSDYGQSTGRIVSVFFGLTFGFAAIYANLPGAVQNMDVEPHLPLWHYFLLLLLRPVYFSVVTMTTLGFGDMYACPQSLWGHTLLTIQVILGYVLLGALVTRFAVLFTAGGPAGKFTEDE